MTSDGFGEMFEGDSADMCAVKCLLMSIGKAEGLACADPGARTPIGVNGNFKICPLYCIEQFPIYLNDLMSKF